MIFKQTFQLGLEDVGGDGKATNRTILAMMEDVAGLHSSTVGFGLLDIGKSGVAWVLLNWHVKILKRPQYMDQVECHTWARGADRISALRDFELHDAKTGELLAIGSSRWLIMDLKRRRPVRLNEENISVYEPELERSVFEEPMMDLKPVKEADFVVPYSFMRRDMDVNGHVHNLSYLDAAYEVLPEGIYKTEEFREIQISYKKEILAGVPVMAAYQELEKGRHQITFTSNEQLNAVVELSI